MNKFITQPPHVKTDRFPKPLTSTRWPSPYAMSKKLNKT